MTQRRLMAAIGRMREALARYRPLVLLYLAGVVLFAGFREILLLHNHASIRKATWLELGNCFRVGWFYDTAMLCTMLLPFVVAFAVLPAAALNARWFRRTINTIAAVFISGWLLACVSDLFFFDHYADRLNYLVFSYNLFRIEVIAMILDGYPAGWGLVLTLMMGMLFYTLFARAGWPATVASLPPGRRFSSGLFMIAVAWLGVMGPPQPDFRTIGPSYICKEHVVNRASLNCMSTLSRALLDVATERSIKPEGYGFSDGRLAFGTAAQMLRQPNDVPVQQPGNPIVRVSQPTTQPDASRPPPNVVIVIMESMASQYFGTLGGSDAWTPELESLGAGGVQFDRFYAAGTRTSRGLVAILSGFPDMPGLPIATSRHLRGPFLSLAQILRDRGYATLFVHGGNLKFNDVKQYIRGHGFNTIIDRPDFDDAVAARRAKPLGAPGEACFTTFWSVDDQSVFLRSLEAIRRQRGPFFAAILTLTNHPSYDVPHDAFDWTVRRDQKNVPVEMSEEERAVRYADWAVGDFMRRAARESWFDNTVFVFVADHCRDQRKEYPVDAANFQIYAAMVGPERLIGPARRVRTIASQTDLAPTILGRLGQPYSHCFFGRDLFAVAPDDGFALLQQNGTVGFVRDGDGAARLVCISPGEPRPAVRGFTLEGREQSDWPEDDQADLTPLMRLRDQGLGLFQSAAELFRSQQYRVK